jgi:hypothetical protein
MPVASVTSELSDLSSRESSPDHQEEFTTPPLIQNSPSPTQAQHDSPRPCPTCKRPRDETDSENEENENNEDNEGATGRKRAPRRTEAEKLNDVLETIQKTHWSFKQFLEVMAKNRNDRKVSRSFHQLKTFAYKEVLEVGGEDSLMEESILGPKEWRQILDAQGWNRVADILRKELKELSKTPHFGKFSVKDQVGSLDKIDEFYHALKQKAPLWLRIFHQSSHRASQPEMNGDLRKEVIIMGLLCANMHNTTSDNLKTMITMHLYKGGIKRRALDTLTRMGLCTSYHHVRNVMEKGLEPGEKLVRIIPALLVSHTNLY